MSAFLRKILPCSVAALLSFLVIPAQANVMLTFNVNHVSLTTCSGPLQPDCSVTDAAGFQETVLVGGMPLAARTSSDGGVMTSEAHFGFPLSGSGSPYTSLLRARVSGPVTSEQSFTQVDNSFDKGGAAGTASALISSDVTSDTTDALGVRRQQEYQLGYTLFGQFDKLCSYTDLAKQSLDDFFSKYIGTMFGSFDESGSNGALDPLTLHLTDYAFSEYTGDVTLAGVELVDPAAVPEPGSAALVLAAALGMLCVRRRRTLRASAACRL